MEIVVYYLVKKTAIQRMLMSMRKTGEEKIIYIKVSAPIIGYFMVGLRNDSHLLGNKWNHRYGLKNMNIQNLWPLRIYQI